MPSAVSLLLASSSLIKVTPGLMVWTLISFGVTLFVLWKFAFGPIQKVIDERRDRIRQTIEEADRVRAESEQLLAQQREVLEKARGEAEQILAESRRVAEAQQQRLRKELDAERQRRLEETRREIEAETSRAISQIRIEVAALALDATEKVTGKVLTADDQRRLIEQAIEELDFSVLEGDRA